MNVRVCLLVSLAAAAAHLVSSYVPPISLHNEAMGSTSWLLSRHKRDTLSHTRDSCKNQSVVPATRVDTTDHLRRLRLRMKSSSYDAYIIPTNDEHQSEYVAEHDMRRAFISGFFGSAGTAVVLQAKAALWTDGRYFLQAENELDCNWILMKQNEKGTPTVYQWLLEMLRPGSVVGADSKLISQTEWITLQKKLEKAKIQLIGDSKNLIDDIWNIPQGRAPESVAHIFVHDIKFAGKSWEEKLEDLRKILREKDVDGTIITAIDQVAWLFNLRGTDVPYTPVFKAYAFVSQQHIRLYIKLLKLTEDVRKHLKSIDCNDSSCVQIKRYNETFQDITELLKDSGKILVPTSSSYAIYKLIPEDQRVVDESPPPVMVMKTVKNPVEIQGMKNAHLKDAVAIVDFMAMLEKEVTEGKHWDEIKASRMLTKFRSEQEYNRGESFPAISASGSNGAIIHYTPQPVTNKAIDTENLYLLDSGGQYLDGTTDITRTFHFGQPSEFEKEAYTRVLMGAINILTAVFPEGVTGNVLDIIARQPLYEVGLNYLHGTGHGIGHFLGVHEGPITIRNPALSEIKGYPLQAGMFLSDEPGYYENGKFGIRLETSMMVVKANTPHKFNNAEYYTFEPIALVPFEPKLIKLELLTDKQIKWLNDYNAKVRNVIGVELQKQGRKKGLQWLLKKTEYISVHDCTNGDSNPAPHTIVLLIFIAVSSTLFM